MEVVSVFVPKHPVQMMISLDLVSSAIHGVCAFNEDKSRYYTWSGLCTEGNCAGMYSVYGRVIVDNMYEFQHSSPRADCTF